MSLNNAFNNYQLSVSLQQRKAMFWLVGIQLRLNYVKDNKVSAEFLTESNYIWQNE